MITKNEIETMMSSLDEGREKFREVLQLAFVAANLCGVEEDYYRIRDELARTRNRVVDIERERDGWVESAAQHLRNEQFYRDLLHKCADLLGEECRWQDDGGTVPEGDFLALKVPEVLEKRLEQLDFQLRQTGLGMTECCRMSCQISELEAELKATQQIAAREREVRKRDVEALESALLSEQKGKDDWKDLCQQMHRRVETLEAEACRLHTLWHNAEHKLTQIKALTSPDKTA